MGPALAGLAALALPASAHVEWFAPDIVGAAAAPVSRTLTDPWFRTGIAPVPIFVVATRLFEESTVGARTLDAMGRVTNPLWLRLDDFVRIVVAGSLGAIVSVSGVYLTPAPQTPAEWIYGSSS